MPEQEKVVTKKFGGMPLRETLILSFSLICILAAGAYSPVSMIGCKKTPSWTESMSNGAKLYRLSAKNGKRHWKILLVLTIGRSISVTAWRGKKPAGTMPTASQACPLFLSLVIQFHLAIHRW